MGLELCSKCHRMHYSTDKCAATESQNRADQAPSLSRQQPRGIKPLTGVAPAQALEDSLASAAVTPKRGRPKTITDMKAYKRVKAREYRDRKRLGK